MTGADDRVEVVGEAELAWRLHVDHAGDHRPVPWLVVTGTRGTGATAAALGHVLKAAGLRAEVAGEGGVGLLDAVRRSAVAPALDVLVVGLSRRQLLGSSTLRPHTAVVLDLGPDDDGAAAATPASVAKGVCGSGTVAVYRREDPATVRLADAADARAGITLGSPAAGELGLVEDLLVDRAFPHLPSGDVPGEATVLATLDDLRPVDVDDLTCALAAAALARSYGVPAAAVRDGLRAWAVDGAPRPGGPARR